MCIFKEIYEKENGCHFNKELLEYAFEEMSNKDNSIGNHWKLEETTQVAKSMNIPFVYFNEYDWSYVLNMMYSDYYKPNRSVSDYVELAKDFLMDDDAPKGKAYRYFIAMKEE